MDGGSTRLGSKVPEQVSVSKSVAFSIRFCLFFLFHDETRTNMFRHDFRWGRCGLNSAWLKDSKTGFGFEIRCILGPFLRCSRLFLNKHVWT